MKITSWNLNGIRACYTKGLMEFIKRENSEIYCFQEIKACKDKIPESIVNLENYHKYTNPAERKGSSGTMILSKKEAKNVSFGIKNQESLNEGRVITLEFEDYYLVNVYTPNSKQQLLRLEFRKQWDLDFTNHILDLDEIKPVIICGDLNVAHKEIDLANPKNNLRNPGFTTEERMGFQRLIDSQFIDCFRIFNKEPNNYTWWSYRTNARSRNVGWRIDYFLASQILKEKITSSRIHADVHGSDHCPVSLEVKI